MRINPLLITALILVSILPLASAFKYEVTGYKGTPYSLGADNGFALNYSGNCQMQMSTTTTYTVGLPFISHVEWFSPTTSLAIGTADVTYSSSSDCRTSGGTSLQTVSKDSTTGIYENKITFSPLSATGGFAQTKTKYICDANGGSWTNITVTPENTSYSACQWIMSDNNKFQAAAISDFIAGFNSCGTQSYTNDFLNSACGHYTFYAGSGSIITPDNGTILYVYPFNSTGGYITYSFSVPQRYYTGDSQFLGVYPYTSFYYVIQLINLNTGQTQLIVNESYACQYNPCYFDVTQAAQGINYGLELNAPYAFLVSFYGIGAETPNFMIINTYPPVLNLSILAEQPDLICTAYSDCINGSKSRLCHDNKGLIADRNEFQECFSLAQNQIFLGFDSGYTASSWYCSEGIYNIFSSLCTRDPNLRPRRLPNGWYRNGQFITDITARSGWIEDYVDVDLTDYYAPDRSSSEGSLKLWFIPRKPFVPVYNGTGTGQVVCMNTTEGQVGGMQYYVNDTFWISRNITALSPYMSISYRAKKCPMTVQQTAFYTPCTIPCRLAGNCGNSGLCANTTKIPGTLNSAFGDDYYTGDGCPQIPSPSTLGVEIENIDTGEYIQSYVKSIEATNWILGYQEDNINDMNISAVYKLSFAAYPTGGITTSDGNCVMIDDVNVNFRETPTPCTSGCDPSQDYNGDGIKDYTYIEATRLSASSCTIEVKTLDPRCTPAALTKDAQAMQDGTLNCTCDNSTMICVDPVTKLYSFTQNNAECTARAAAAAQQQGAGTPITLAEGFRSTLEPLGLGFLLFWATPILITFIIISAIGAYIGYKSKHWELGSLIMLGLVIIFSIPPMSIFPIWIPIILGVLVSLLIGEAVVKKAKGG